MSYGSMNRMAEIIAEQTEIDSEGFATEAEATLAVVHVYREGRHGSYRWANLAAFSDATDLFRFRRIRDLSVEPGMYILCDEARFLILSVENVKGRGMYTEVLARKVVPTYGES